MNYADPYAVTPGQTPPPAYATTYYFNADGTPSCQVRGTGEQPYTEATNETSEIFPTCFGHRFANHTEQVDVRDAASRVTGSPQAGVVHTSYATAIGRPIGRSTWQGATRLDHVTLDHDRLGHQISMTRYQDADGGTKPVTSAWQYDSLGQVLQLDEPDTATLRYDYDRWGQLTRMHRQVTAAGGATELQAVHSAYDSLGRLIHREHRINEVADPATVNDYLYDDPVNIAPQVTPTYVLGRLAQASSPTGTESFSYDAFGALNARVFTDAHGGMYIEKHETHADGSPKSLDLYLPDTAYAQEHVAYSYDSAGRGLTVQYTAGSEATNLYTASTIDPFGRVRQAQYGAATYAATYADVGRQLLAQVSVTSPLGSRALSFPSYDPVGRERSRSEVKSGVAGTTTTTSAYDAVGQLSHAVRTLGTTTQFDQHFTYDPLGNLLGISDTPAGGAASTTTLGYLDTDRDRLCHIAYGGAPSTTCNVSYDGVGNIVSQKTATGTRQYGYYIDGAVRTITDDKGSAAQFRYDAFGEVQELDLTSTTSLDTRRDRRYGGLLSWRDVTTGMSRTSVLTRAIPGPDGFLASRRGAGGPWVFTFGEARGARFSTDQTGAFIQDVDYQPFGTPTSTGAQPGSLLYSSEQWNGGDALAAFGITKLGARLYDPAIGRFLSRDPLLIPRSAAQTNPYAFAMNDPVNLTDPSGMEVAECIGLECYGSHPDGDPTGRPAGLPATGPSGHLASPFTPVGPIWVQGAASPGEKGSTGGSPRSVAQTLQSRTLLTASTGPGLASGAGDPGLETFMGIRIPSSSNSKQLAPRAFYTNWRAAEDAAAGYVHLAELAEAGHGCAYCHVQHGLNRKPTDAELDLDRYFLVAGSMGAASLFLEAALARMPMPANENCFSAGTPVQTETGLVPIQDVEVGQRVWSRDEATGRVALRRVTQMSVTEGQRVIRVVLVATNGATETLMATREHPFWTSERGWVGAGHLRYGERVLQREGTWLEVAAVESTSRRETVYNLAVAEFHTYFVGAHGAWVHNTSSLAPTGAGRGGTRLKPDSSAQGSHTTFKRDPQTGRVTGHAEWDAAGNPVKRTDLTGAAHGPVPTPHTHEYGPPNVNPATGKSYPGRELRIRPATPDEIPR